MIYQRPTKTITGAYTTTDADNGYRIICNSASPLSITLHTATGKYNFDLEIDNIGAGIVTIGTQTIRQYAHAHIGCDGTNWAVGVDGVSKAAAISIEDTTGNFTATNVEEALAELFTNVSNGKTQIAAAITGKGVTTAATDSFATMATNIANISGGGGGGSSGIVLVTGVSATIVTNDDTNQVSTIPGLPEQSIAVSVA